VEDQASSHVIKVRNSMELKQSLTTFLDSLMVSFEIDKEKNNQLKLHLINCRLTATLFLIDQYEDVIQCLTYRNTNNLGQSIKDIKDSQSLREMPIHSSSTNKSKICNLQRVILEYGINLRDQIQHINSTFQNTICSGREIYLYEAIEDPDMVKCSIKNSSGKMIVIEVPNSDGRYSQLTLQDEHILSPFEFVMQYRSEQHYLFVVKNNGIPIFIRKTYEEVEQLVVLK
jgi:hypothetical protein